MIPSFDGNLLTLRHEICSQETRDSAPSYGENPASLSHLGLIRYRVVTPGQTEGQTELRQLVHAKHCTLWHVERKQATTDSLLPWRRCGLVGTGSCGPGSTCYPQPDLVRQRVASTMCR